MPDQPSDDKDPPSWADLLDLQEAERLPERTWRPEELGQVLRHQLSSPVQFDLRNMGGVAAGKLRALCAAEGLLVRSFNDLLHHPHPPIELLEMTKQFAKSCHSHPDALLPKDIALLLYYATIVVAILRCDQRITDLDDKELARGIRWALQCAWLDEPTRLLLNEGLEKISVNASSEKDAKVEESRRERT